MNIIVIIAVLIVLGISIMIFTEGQRKLARADALVDMVARLVAEMADALYKNGIIDSVPDFLREGRKDEEVSTERKSKQPQKVKETMQKNLDNAVYSGVMHIFVRNKTKKERPVMTYKWKEEDVYFEYDETGKVVRICGDAKKQLLNVLNGGEERNFKKYELVI